MAWSFPCMCLVFWPRDYQYPGFSRAASWAANLLSELPVCEKERLICQDPMLEMVPMCFPLMKQALSVKSRVTFRWALKCIVCVANGFLMLFMHTARGKASRRWISEWGIVCSNSCISSSSWRRPWTARLFPHSSGTGCFLSLSDLATYQAQRRSCLFIFCRSVVVFPSFWHHQGSCKCLCGHRQNKRLHCFSLCTGVAIFKALGLTCFICTLPANSPSKLYYYCSRWVSHHWVVALGCTTAVHSNIGCRLGQPPCH